MTHEHDTPVQVTLLGTGTSTGVPVIGCTCRVCTSSDPRDQRTRCSAHIEVGGMHLVIDTGPDFRRQALREGLSRVDAVLFTHHHFDHVVGLDDLRPFRLVYDVSGPDRHSARKPGPKANAVVRGGKAQRNTVTETRGSGQPRRGRGRPKSAARSAETCTSIVRFPACDGTVRFPPASFARTCDRFRRRRLREAGRCRLTRRRGLRLTSGEHQGAVLGDGDGVFRVSRA